MKGQPGHGNAGGVAQLPSIFSPAKGGWNASVSTQQANGAGLNILAPIL
ncbi:MULTISPECIES: hypothetical protein [Achromobacter]|nr:MULTISPECIES: hypothetical protein [Achromobacter]